MLADRQTFGGTAHRYDEANRRFSNTLLLNPHPHEGHGSIRISLLLYLGFVVTPIVNIHVVKFWV